MTQSQLQMLWQCRNPKEKRDLDTLIGWTDQGPQDPSAEQEPVCPNGERLEHASFEQPVIYYASDRPEASVLIHEGIHAYEHPNFSRQLRDYVNEGATEYLTRQIADKQRLPPSSSGYGNRVEDVKKLVEVIGEEAFRKAYFQGDFEPANKFLGKCGLEAWAQSIPFGDLKSGEILRDRKGDYCAEVNRY